MQVQMLSLARGIDGLPLLKLVDEETGRRRPPTSPLSVPALLEHGPHGTVVPRVAFELQVIARRQAAALQCGGELIHPRI